MRILYLGSFRKSYATERYVQYALSQLGCHVRPMDVKANQHRNILQEMKNGGYDLLLTSKASCTGMEKIVKTARNSDIKTVSWAWDLFWGYGRRIPPQMQHSELVLSTDGGHSKNWEEAGIVHKVLRQGIHLPEHKWIPPDPSGFQHEIAFVGSTACNRQRKMLIAWLRKMYGNRVTLFNGFRGIRLNEIVGSSKIVVGDSFNVKNYWSNRIYEITGRGGFILHPETVGLDEEFDDGKHYASYPRGEDKGPLMRAIDHFLSPSGAEEREVIRRKGFEHTGQHYTYEARCRSLLHKVRSM